MTDTEVLIGLFANILELYARMPENPGKTEMEYAGMLDMPDEALQEMKELSNEEVVENIKVCLAYMFVKANKK